ncbi:50S ribosomal protein L24 [Coprothermobacteraceae bacterium]|nr:50S ribosomal protein L24 [Coprothermobacteraceae bacterium]
MKLKMKTGDMVQVISGKEKGKRGKIIKAFPRYGTVVVQGVNIVTKAVRPSQKDPQGGLKKFEAPIRASKVMVVCPKCDKPTRVQHKVLQDGTKVRVCARCGESLD